MATKIVIYVMAQELVKLATEMDGIIQWDQPFVAQIANTVKQENVVFVVEQEKCTEENKISYMATIASQFSLRGDNNSSFLILNS